MSIITNQIVRMSSSTSSSDSGSGSEYGSSSESDSHSDPDYDPADSDSGSDTEMEDTNSDSGQSSSSGESKGPPHKKPRSHSRSRSPSPMRIVFRIGGGNGAGILSEMCRPGAIPLSIRIPSFSHLPLPSPPPPPPPRGGSSSRSHSRSPPPPPGANKGGGATAQRKKKPTRKEIHEYTRLLSQQEYEYFTTLNDEDKYDILQLESLVQDAAKERLNTPMRFKILKSDMDPATKLLIINKLEQFQRMHEGSGEYFKLRNWIQAVSRLPLGRVHPLPVSPSDPYENIAAYLSTARASLDATVYGHTAVKDQMMRILAQWISNPGSKGNCIGLHGDPGVGKTLIVKNGLCRALNLPFGFVGLGGAADGSFLEGHGFTYEGSTYGKIAEILMKTQVMNPVFFFDELDKVSQTRRGEEISGILTHLTDSTQNDRFNDRYFAEIDLNLSQSLIVFTYNNEELINPILKDRMITIHVPGYSSNEKVIIARDFLIPSILKEYSLTPADIVFSDDTITEIIQAVEKEEGVRNLKRGIESIVGWINMHRYVPPDPEGAPDTRLALPIRVTEKHITEYLKKSLTKNNSQQIRDDILKSLYT